MNELPENGKRTIDMYVNYGYHTGSFMEAVLSNDLMGAFGCADDESRAYLFDYTSYIYNKTPMNCHGSRKIYNNWCASGGLEGQKKEKENERSK